ncbi:tRNA-modifying protein ygfZ [Candidatus Westeberhardia cardiocondylae]|uniref:tRNA-modifying protein ygfZ n=1 Tax=Candidatus Westeberhardia cardiocondylae TaxID=1594731 RepID=A0A0H5BWY7_9ENTR|nr:tRNA-modifying protein YgfZ [Candidatus Westeberhardia cardiocondylae]CEN32270.1 tRNA-modifying protein ygfZ [Candidatus Westeberhardia cardiocondylae]
MNRTTLCKLSSFPVSSKKLPFTIISLKDWKLITIKGTDNIQYLQGQLTCNLFFLKKNQFSFSGHCNEKGKILSSVYIFYYKKEKSLAYIVRKSIYHNQMKILKKYAIFSKITITAHNDIVLFGVSGHNTKKIISTLLNKFKTLQPVMQNPDYTLLYFNFPIPRFLFITSIQTSNMLKHRWKNFAKFNNSKQWLSLEIEAGYPIIDTVSQNKYLPQDINLQILKGVDFNKGCYMGQEIITKYQYQKIKKYSLYFLSGEGTNIPHPGDTLEVKIENDWYFIGTILTSCKMLNNIIWIQAVLNNKLTSHKKIRAKNNNTILSIKNLYYKKFL